ncbi:glycosyltransferase family 8 protein [Botryobasidium botryosum FD-172 SS1]|uniref:Glycosyltransferase family 8 protein n=1 Tax=Botryobasidium botryosum (strain FD-172 SS1) TaxID=930990 RepID=A0A067N851_BOTB1|nr:glycosyltransferase family 8 protein [Botryobasidium botryosum FD-172 SS1]
MSTPPKAAFATLFTKPAYLPGILVLHHRLVAVGSRYPLVAMVVPQVGEEPRRILRERGIIVREVDNLKPEEGVHVLSEADKRFEDTWTKLKAFELAEYERVVLLDSDMLVRRNMDELMELQLPGSDWIAAAHACTCNPRKFPHYPKDWVPENCAYTPLTHPAGATTPTAVRADSRRTHKLLNSGLVVLTPSVSLMQSIEDYLRTSPLVPTFSFPDQDLLAAFFEGRWQSLPYVYNALKTLRVIHGPLWRDEEVRCLHYILPQKPWHHRPTVVEQGTEEGSYQEMNQWWWQAYDEVEKEMEKDDVQGLEFVRKHLQAA